MKKILIILFVSINFTGYCQFGGIYNFDTPFHGFFYQPDTAWIDTTTSPNHVWEIGTPQKSFFSSVYSAPNAIVTKLNTPYPINDTSSFVIRHKVTPPVVWPYYNGVSGFYKIDSDTLTDYGMIEFSPDNGQNWYNLMEDTVFWDGPIPIFSGHLNGWNYFSNNLVNFSSFNLQNTDTICFKFTFISDGIQTNKEGWMLDDIGLDFIGEGIQENNNGSTIKVSPNPATDFLDIKSKIVLKNVEIFNTEGRQVFSKSLNRNCETIDTRQLNEGFYFAVFQFADNTMATKKIVIIRNQN